MSEHQLINIQKERTRKLGDKHTLQQTEDEENIKNCSKTSKNRHQLINCIEGKLYTGEEILASESEIYYIDKRTTNTLKTERIEREKIPLIGKYVRSNDYLPIMGMLLTAFTVGLWLNLRATQLALTSLPQDTNSTNNYKEIAALYFTFTGSLIAQKTKISIAVQYLALSLPVIILLISWIVDMWPIVSAGLGYSGEKGAIMIRIIIAFLTFTTTGFFSVLNIITAMAVDSSMTRSS